MREFQCLLFVLKRSYICYYVICITIFKTFVVPNLKFQCVGLYVFVCIGVYAYQAGLICASGTLGSISMAIACWYPISGQCSHFIPPKITRKPLVFRGYKMGTLTRNGLN